MSDLQLFLGEALKNVAVDELKLEPPEKQSYDIQAEIQELVLQQRTLKGLTQQQLAKQAKVTQANISKIEKGAYCPSVVVLQRIADALGKRLRVTFVEEGE